MGILRTSWGFGAIARKYCFVREMTVYDNYPLFYTQKVRGSSPLLPTTHKTGHFDPIFWQLLTMRQELMSRQTQKVKGGPKVRHCLLRSMLGPRNGGSAKPGQARRGISQETRRRRVRGQPQNRSVLRIEM